MIKHIIWDLDGTLVNSQPEIIYHLNKAVESAGITPDKKKNEFRIGPTIDKVINSSYSDVTDIQLKQAIKNFRLSYDNCGFAQTEPFAGIEELLRLMKMVNHHIITNKPTTATKNLLTKLNWQNMFRSVRSPYIINGEISPKSKLIEDLLLEFKAESSDFISIGDMANDAIAAQSNSIYAIGVTWGSGQVQELEHVCQHIVSTVDELKQIIIKQGLLLL